MRRAAEEAARRALRTPQFPSGPTFSQQIDIKWDVNFFAQFESWACPWRAGIWGKPDGSDINQWLWISGVIYSGPTANTQPITVHSPHLAYQDDSEYVIVADAIEFSAVDDQNRVYRCNHAPLTDRRHVEGGGVPEQNFLFENWKAQIQV